LTARHLASAARAFSIAVVIVFVCSEVGGASAA
jgi:hypothetical protein